MLIKFKKGAVLIADLIVYQPRFSFTISMAIETMAQSRI